MNRKDAFTTLGLAENASPEDVKKAFRKLAAKYHPDVNKADDAEAQFKKVNEAFQMLEKPEKKAGNFHHENYIWDIFNPFKSGFKDRAVNVVNVDVPITIKFEEAIMGCEKEINFYRHIKCDPCSGTGATIDPSVTVCSKCDGNGRITIQRGGSIFITTCSSCNGQQPRVSCVACSGGGSVGNSASYKISIPPGVESGNKLRLAGAGNFYGGDSLFGAQYTDALINVTVNDHVIFRRQGNDVLSDITVSLKDALVGHKQRMSTIWGEVEVYVPPRSKHRDEVLFNDYGVRSKNGSHRFVINVEYPENVDNIVDLLKSEK